MTIVTQKIINNLLFNKRINIKSNHIIKHVLGFHFDILGDKNE